ncbi:MAG: AI-2E family transporter [Bryobacteraceae bacterium]
MLGFDKRAAAYTWTAAAVLVTVYLAYLLRKMMFIFVLALLFAYLLMPLVDMLDRLLSRRTRTPALALAYMIFVAVLVVAGMQIGSRAVDQGNRLAKDFPVMLERWKQPSQGVSPAVNSFKEQVLNGIQEQVRGNTAKLLSALPEAGRKVLSIAGDAVFVVIIPILAFFFLKDAHSIRDNILRAIGDRRRRELIDGLMADAHLLLAHYMRALVLLSLATFLVYGAFFLILGVPYTVLLAVMAAVLEFLPMIGPLAAAVVIVIVGGLNGVSVLAILIFLGVYRLFQDYVLTPHIMGRGVELHPLLVIFGVFAGGEIAGIPGAFLSVPALALLRVVFRRIVAPGCALTPPE